MLHNERPAFLAQLLRSESPVLLAKEVVWRFQRQRKRKRWDEGLLARRATGQCPVGFKNIQYYKPDLDAARSQHPEHLLAYADLIVHGKFPFLGYGTVELGSQPPWNTDFVSSLSWPKTRSSQVEVKRFDGSDVKVPWELGRLQFLPVLAKAHLLTGREEYRETAQRLLEDWIDKNAWGYGVHWTMPMEAALRGISICLFLSLVWPLREADRPWLKKVEHSLWEHFLYIEANIEFSHLSRSNHYLSNVLGLYVLASFLAGNGMEMRRARYRKLLEREILHQVYEDGGDYESSTGYHVLVTQMFTTAYFVMLAGGDKVSPGFHARLESMYCLMHVLSNAQGALPHIGDCDDGRVELLSNDLEQMVTSEVSQRDSLRISGLLGVGDALFDLGSGGSAADACWYGSGGPRRRAASKTSGIWPQSGLAIHRRGDAQIIFCALPNGIHGKGSHTHNDKLSVLMRLAGNDFLCDRGTGVYTRDAVKRNTFRSTASHNTIMVDAAEQNSIWPETSQVFRIGREAQVTAIARREQQGAISFSASHLGYRNLGVTPMRSVHSVADDRLLIEDQLHGSGTHSVQLNFYIPDHWRLLSADGRQGRVAFHDSRYLVEMTFTGPAEMSVEHEETILSKTYGGTCAGLRIHVDCKCELPARVETSIAWRPL
jgi:hypothetical protein